MYLKAVEISGFKSFAEKVRLNYETGITCIVGPNGCGKSNVVDAIRWCIGEKSWKQLRSPSMVDIIFNGTAKRMPLNVAEVNMVFDNASKRLAIDFPEVTVTRKIFRSGESAYFLNKVQCRLRDIRDLFLDTGIGGGGYAIIDQGGVEYVLSASPEVRRELFEEAAGVSKYKSKRDEAQRKLEKVDIDLNRLMDSVAIIREQVKKLDAEAQKARQAKKWKEELRDSEIALILQTLKQNNLQINETAQVFNPLSRAIDDIESSVSALEAETAALNLNLTHKQNETAIYSNKISTVKYNIGKMEGELANCDNIINELENQIKAFAQDDELAFARIKQLEPAIERIKQTLEGILNNYEPLKARYDDAQSRLKSHEAQLNALQQEIETSNVTLIETARAQMESSNIIAAEKSALNYGNESIVNSEKEYTVNLEKSSAAKKEIEDLEAELNLQKQTEEEAKTTLNLARESRNQYIEKRNRVNEQLSAVRSDKAGLSATMEVIKRQGSKDAYWTGNQKVLGLSLPGVKGTLRHNLTIPADKLMFAEEALGKFLDFIVCDTPQTAKQCVEQLKNEGALRFRFIILSQLPQNTANDLVLANYIECAPEFKNLINTLLNNVSLENNALIGPFWYLDGAGNVESPEPYWAKEEEVRRKLETALEQETLYTAELNKAASELNRLEEELAVYVNNVNTETVKTKTLEHTISRKKDDLVYICETLELLDEEKEKLFSEREKKQAHIAQLEIETAKQTSLQEELNAKLETLKSSRIGEQERINLLREEISDLSAQLSELNLQRSGQEADLKAVETEDKNAHQAIEQREIKRAQANERIAVTRNQKAQHEETLTQERNMLADLEVRDAALKEDLAAIKTEFDEKSRQAYSKRNELSDMKVKATELEIKLRSLKAQSENATERLAEEFSLTVEEALMKYENFTVDYERFKRLKKRLENMGAVNMTAPEEYDALKSRDDFLTSQIHDLEQAKADLKTAINKINDTTKENFKVTYEKVRENFKRIYKTLFVGGEADLILTNPEDMLLTGVEIMAQPPGKKLQSISSLSGGEKALTALSLLFSFFVVNPSPFCIMDEADAPLDEANVERFVSLLKEFTQQTQFIVITHNKRTMEAADVLYGVTMQESGVSKLMSVSLGDKVTADIFEKKTEALLN